MTHGKFQLLHLDLCVLQGLLFIANRVNSLYCVHDSLFFAYRVYSLLRTGFPPLYCVQGFRFERGYSVLQRILLCNNKFGIVN